MLFSGCPFNYSTIYKVMKITLLLWLFLAITMNYFGQSFTCPHDTCINGGFPTMGDFQWSGGGDATLGECPTCIPMDRFYSWTLLDTGNLVVVHGNFFPPCDTVEIRVVSQCRFVYMDTCLTLPLTGSGCEFILDIDPPADAQLMVYWRSGGTDSVGVISNEVNDGNPLSTVLYDMHLCTVLSIADAPEPPHFYQSLDMVRGRRGESVALPPRGLSVRSDGRLIWTDF